MSSIYDWSKTPANNASSDSGINWAEGQAPSTVNNSSRAEMGRVAEWRDDLGGVTTTGGTGNAITVTANSAFTAYATGQIVAFKATADNTGNATLNANSIGAKSIRKFVSSGELGLEAGDIQQDGVYVVIYDAALNSAAGGWHLVNPSIVNLSGLTITSTDAGAGIGPVLELVRNSASPAASDFGGSINFRFRDSAANNDTMARIFPQLIDPTSGSEDADLFLQVMVGGSLTNIMQLTAAGAQTADVSVGAGTTEGARLGNGGHASQFARSGNAVMQLQRSTSDGTIEQFYRDTTIVGTISVTTTATAYNTSSDGRRKKNLRDFDSGGFLDALDVWLFDWIDGGTGYGVIAQQAQVVFPDAISKDEEGWLYADYSKFVPLLIREVKMLRSRVASLEAGA